MAGAPLDLVVPPSSPLFNIRRTESAGRGVFATQDIPRSTTIYTTKNTPASVIYRVFRKEACAWCFAYDSGRTWKMTLELGSAGAMKYFCSEPCRAAWDDEYDAVGKEAWNAVETWLRKAGKEPEEVMGVHPSEEDIDVAWREAAAIGVRIVEARRSEAPTKAHVRLMNQYLASAPSPDAIGLLLSGILSHPEALQSTLQLEPAPRPYRSAAHLQNHVLTYGILLCLLPLPLLPRVTVSNIRAIASVDVRNSFGIWSFPGDSTSEMLGYGIWPDASFFNHSCVCHLATCRPDEHSTILMVTGSERWHEGS